MKIKLLFSFLIIGIKSFAQTDSIPVYTADTSTPPPRIDVLYTDDGNNPSTYTRTDYYPAGNLFVVMSKESNRQMGGSGFPVPKQFIHKVKTDSTMAFSSPKGFESPRPDSVERVDHAAVDSFYQNNPYVKIDTIYLAKDNLADYNEYQYADIKCVSHYVYKEKDGTETGYYDIHELKGMIVNDHFRIKYEGHWRNGEKNGTWKYYDRTGKLIRKEEWKKGELKSTN